MLLCCACLLARTRRAHSANKRALARSKDIEGLARRAIVSYFTREEERRSRSTQIMMKLELISCQASSDATAQLSSETSRTVLDLFTGLPLAGWLLSPVPALKPPVSVPACSPSFLCPIIRKQYLLLAVLPNGVLYSAYRQGLYLASFIPEKKIQSNRITWRATFLPIMVHFLILVR